MADIFLSYARENESQARRLATGLVSRGWSVFWDRRIPHGKDFNAYIEAQLRDARCIVVLWSSAAIASQFVRDEAAEGLTDGRLVPCLIETVKPPLGFRQLQTANLTDWLAGASHDEFERFTQSIAVITPLSEPNSLAPSGSDESPTRDASRLLLMASEGESSIPAESDRRYDHARWTLVRGDEAGRRWLVVLSVVVLSGIAVALSRGLVKTTPLGPAPDTYWYTEIPDLRKTFGSPTWCEFELTLSRVHVSMNFDQRVTLTTADLGFVYNERVTDRTSACRSGIRPDTNKTFSLAAYKHSGRTLHVEFKDNTSLPPGSSAILKGTFDERGPRFQGVLTILRKDQKRVDRPDLDIFDWVIEQRVTLTPP